MVEQRQAALERTNLTAFILSTAMEAAQSAIDRAERITLSERDSLRVLDLLENAPAPNARLKAAARALPRHARWEPAAFSR